MEKAVAKEAGKAAAKKAAKKKVKKALAKVGLGKGMRGHSRALAQSLYFNSIMDPFNVPGAKIPDENVVPTFTAQTVTRYIASTQTGTGGNVGVGFGRCIGACVGPAAANALAITTPGATAGAYAYTNAGGSTPTNPAFNTFNQFSASRCVSAALAVSYLGSPNNATGRLILAFLPGPGNQITSATTGVPNATVAGLLSSPFVVEVPASRGFALIRWLPSDPLSLSYETSGSVAYGTVRGPAASNFATYGSLVCICDGLPTNNSIEFTLVENYEFTPVSSATNLFGATPSLSDPLEMAAVRNALASAPTASLEQIPGDTIIGTPFAESAAKIPHVRVAKESAPAASMLDRVLEGVGKISDMAMKVAPVVGTVLAAL